MVTDVRRGTGRSSRSRGRRSQVQQQSRPAVAGTVKVVSVGRCGHDRRSRAVAVVAVAGPGRGRDGAESRQGHGRCGHDRGSRAVAIVAVAGPGRGRDGAESRRRSRSWGPIAAGASGSGAVGSRAGVANAADSRGRGRRRCEGCGRRSRRQGCQVGGRSDVSGGARSSAGVRVAEKSL